MDSLHKKILSTCKKHNIRTHELMMKVFIEQDVLGMRKPIIQGCVELINKN